MTVKLLTEHHLEFLSLKGGFTGSTESTLVKMPHCWKSDVAAHMQKPPLNAHADISSTARYLCFGLSIHLHPYSVYASNVGSGKSAQMHRLA